MNINRHSAIAFGFAGVALFAGAAVATSASAQTGAGEKAPGQVGRPAPASRTGGAKGISGVFGTVTAISGNTITITGRKAGTATSSVTTKYAVDATNAKIRKGATMGAISSISVGESIVAQGTVTGTNVAAVSIFEMGARGAGGDGKGPRGNGGFGTSTPVLKGNGQPIVAGSITAINGTSLTVTNPGGATYSVDASGAKFIKGADTVAVSDIAVSDKVVIQGSVSGTSVVASTVIKQAVPQIAGAQAGGRPRPQGFFGGIGQFFGHLFGF
jgi:hypothetical protein